MNSLMLLEESVAPTRLSGAWVPGGVGQAWAPVGSTEAWGGAMPNPNNPTIAIGPAFGTQLVRGGGVEAVPSPQSQGPMRAYAPPAPSSPASPPAYEPSPSGPDWTPQPGMLYAAGQAYTPQDYINRFGYATYLSVAGGGAASVSPSSASAAALPPAPTAAPSGAPVSISPVGLQMPAQTVGQGVSVSAPTLDFSSYFAGGSQPTTPQVGPGIAVKPPRLPPRLPPAHEPIAHRPQRPLRGMGQTESELKEGMLFNFVLLAGLLWFVGTAYRTKK